jgi:hypothetical protein
LFDSGVDPNLETPIWMNIKGAGSYILRALIGSASTFTGFSELGPIAIVAVTALYVYCFNEFSSKQLQMHTAWVGGTLLYWFLLAISRGHLNEPTAPRYTIVGALTLLILMSDCLIIIFSHRKHRSIIYGFGVVASLVISSNWGTLELRTNDFQYLSAVHRAKFTAIEFVELNLPNDFAIDPVNLPQFDLKQYLAAVQTKGSLAYPFDELSTKSLGEKMIIDEVLKEFSLWTQNDNMIFVTSCKASDNHIPGSSIVLRNVSDLEQSAKVYGFASTELWTLQVPAKTTIEFQWNGNTKFDIPFKIELNGLAVCS